MNRFGLGFETPEGKANRACLGASLLIKYIDPGEVIVSATKSVLVAFLLLCSANGFAQSVDKEPAAVLELGAAPNLSLKGGGSSFGPTVAVEVTPIENWLELEAGVTPLFARRSTEWDTDLLFKKPWTLSHKSEFMFGVGPEWIHTSRYNVVTNSVGAEVALDFMFWPSGKHKIGWYLEPSYDYDFGRGHDQAVSISGGLLIAIP
jgi:hypothetical protein